MNTVKFLWVLVGVLSLVMIGVIGIYFLNKETASLKAVEVLAANEDNKQKELPVPNEQQIEGVQLVQSNQLASSTPKISSTSEIDWKKKWASLIKEEDQKNGTISEVMEIGDITGDGIPEAVVSSVVIGEGELNSTSNLIFIDVFKLKNGKPTTEIFNEKKFRTNFSGFFLDSEGAVGGTIKLLPTRQAFYRTFFSKGQPAGLNGSLFANDNCEIVIYKWNSQNSFFEEFKEEVLNAQLKLSYCEEVSKKIKEKGFEPLNVQ